MSEYTSRFFDKHRAGARRSARRIVPLILQWCHPRSVVDVGCGTGEWLSVFREHGVDDVLGIDGPYVETEMLEIPGRRFLARDLTKLPLELGRRFDLAVSLEVAEHLPEASADGFVRSLVELAPVVMFSAAVPEQGGTRHRNERWPEYWADLFSGWGYRTVDAVRPLVWDDASVEWWYRQNLVIFAEEARMGEWPTLQGQALEGAPRALVHPELFTEVSKKLRACRADRWRHRRGTLTRRLREICPPGSQVHLVDAARLCLEVDQALHLLPFPSVEGKDAGPPPDTRAALCCLERTPRRAGSYLVLPWTSSWWFDVYPALFDRLDELGGRVVDDEVASVWELSSTAGRDRDEGKGRDSSRAEGPC